MHLRSRNDNDFGSWYPAIAKALSSLPDETIIDGEVVALDQEGRPSFNLLHNHGSSGVRLIFYVFDLLMLSGRDVMNEPLRRGAASSLKPECCQSSRSRCVTHRSWKRRCVISSNL